MPYRIFEQLGRDDIMKENRNITMINYIEAEVTGRLVNVLCQVGFTTLSAKFLILEIPVDRDAPIVLDQKKIRIAKSDSDDKEDYVIKRNEMGTPIHNSRPIGYQNNTNPAENMTLSTLESVINPFRKISVWKKAISFLGSLPAKLRDVEWKPDYKMCYSNPELATGQWKTEIRLTDPYGNIYMQAFVTKPMKRKLSKYHKLRAYDHEAGSSRAKRSRNVETVEEALLPDVHHEFLEWRGCSREAKSRYNSRLATLLPKLIYSPQIVDWQLLHKIGCGDEIDQMLKISLKEAQTEEEVFFSVAWVRAFNIREPIYPELCREFYATYEFDEVCADNELQSKKIISFRLGGRAHSLTLLEFARRLGLYHADELEEHLKMELSGVPCVHAMAGYMHLNKDSYNGEGCLEGHKKKESSQQQKKALKPQPEKVVRPIRRNRQPVRPACASRGGGRGSRGDRMGRVNETINVNEEAEAGVGRGTTVGKGRGRGRRGGGRGRGRKGTGVFLETPAAGYSGGPLTDEREEARVEQEYLDRYRAEQEYEARMDWMYDSHWQSDEDMPANNPTQPTQQSGVQQVQELATQQSIDHQEWEKANEYRMQADEISPPPSKQKKDKAPPLPFRIYVKNRGRSESIANKKKLFKFDDKGIGYTPDLAFDCSP
ncbi:hypothetical protein Tco_0569295 [Tanacetum coccineum]